MKFLFQVIFFLISTLLLLTKFTTADPLAVPLCSSGSVTLAGYYLTNVADNVFKEPTHRTKATLCWTTEGISISESAVDLYPISPHKQCNSKVWENSATLELFISRVASPNDVPIHYYEIDITPTGSVFSTLIENAKGITKTCLKCTIGELDCKGTSTFPKYPELFNTAEKTSNGWNTNRFIPFSMFDEFIFNAETDNKNRFFKINLYRYDYPNGMDKPYELSGANPTFSPSFHIPARFGLIELIEKKTTQETSQSTLHNDYTTTFPHNELNGLNGLNGFQ